MYVQHEVTVAVCLHYRTPTSFFGYEACLKIDKLWLPYSSCCLRRVCFAKEKLTESRFACQAWPGCVHADIFWEKHERNHMYKMDR